LDPEKEVIVIVIPAIDIRQGKCVRLKHGKVEEETIYSDNPGEMARQWVKAGAERLHVVDLDGAFTGTPINFDIVKQIKSDTGVFVEMGGGIRTMETITKVLQAGIDRVILGTVVLEEAGLAKAAFDAYKGKIMVAMDIHKGFVAIKGWKENSGFPLKDALSIVEKLGGEEVIYTDITRDGALIGVNLNGVKEVMEMTKMKIVASGGVTTLQDIQNLKKLGVPACIVGKAIYDKKLDLAQAIAESKK